MILLLLPLLQSIGMRRGLLQSLGDFLSVHTSVGQSVRLFIHPCVMFVALGAGFMQQTLHL